MNKSMKQKRLIVFSAYPESAGELKTIFSTAEGSIRRRLENPPILRDGGWDLRTFDRAKIVCGEMIRVTFKEQSRIDLYQDGTLIFVARADDNFLGWIGTPGHPKIYSLTIVEVIYNFVNFYKLVLDDFKQKPYAIFIRVDLRNMHLAGLKTKLVSQPITGIGTKEAPDNNETIIERFEVEDLNVGDIAHEIVKKIHLWFGFDQIPRYPEIESKLDNGSP